MLQLHSNDRKKVSPNCPKKSAPETDQQFPSLLRTTNETSKDDEHHATVPDRSQETTDGESEMMVTLSKGRSASADRPSAAVEVIMHHSMKTTTAAATAITATSSNGGRLNDFKVKGKPQPRAHYERITYPTAPTKQEKLECEPKQRRMNG